jgi:serine/threonine protein kinase
MLRHDGYVKVLDFGLAKLIDTGPRQGPADEDATTRAMIKTDPGAVVGTAYYMSPEQARGLEVDARTDIWSLGCVIYEMVTGRMPFEGPTTSDVIALILHKEPLPLARYGPEIPAELDRIVTKALEKDQEERYQVVKDLALDLKKLKRHLEFEAELERTVPPLDRSGEPRAVETSSGQAAAAQTGHEAAVRTTSSAEYIVSQIKQHKRGVGLTLAVLLVAAAASIFFYFNRASTLTEKTRSCWPISSTRQETRSLTARSSRA